MEPKITTIDELITSLDKLRERLWNSVYEPDRKDAHLIDDTITLLNKYAEQINQRRMTNDS